MNENNRIVQGGKGILLCLLFYIAFYAIAVSTMGLFGGSGTAWNLFSTAQRTVFGSFALWVLIKTFGRKSLREIIHTKGLKSGFAAGTGIIGIMFLTIIALAAGIKSFAPATAAAVITRLFLQQMATGFWEETAFRGFVCEGYWQNGEYTRKNRIIYASVSFVLFGLIHAVEAEGIGYALFRFLTTGTIGFGFAAMYLYSGCLLAPMILHFLYDIPANVQRFVSEWNKSTVFDMLNDWGIPAFYLAVFIISLVFLLKEPAYIRNDVVKCDENKVSA